ncbi:MAG: RNA polymerase sigma factor [Caldiserica bacterium]|jgi:RNA polymerase sigma-70 factor (ECF subfamily)|nr:RNA polymerase sigma factor [Caldisericota bacterium]MDH7561859.1 RNA polymerase sigma factor [Caldisericota bacterium]
MPEEEFELISRLKKDDKDAFSQLYGKHRLQVFRAAYLILGNREQAEDIMQESFFKLWTNRRKIREGPVLPWLLKVATNASLSLFRKRREYPLEEIPFPESGKDNPEEALIFKEILQGLSKLPKRQRAVLAFRLVFEYSEEETAKILGIPRGTVRSNLFKAKENLRKRINEQGF